jgi:hypothetical protein
MEAALAPWFHRYDTMMDPLLFFRFSIDSAKVPWQQEIISVARVPVYQTT